MLGRAGIRSVIAVPFLRCPRENLSFCKSRGRFLAQILPSDGQSNLQPVEWRCCQSDVSEGARLGYAAVNRDLDFPFLGPTNPPFDSPGEVRQTTEGDVPSIRVLNLCVRAGHARYAWFNVRWTGFSGTENNAIVAAGVVRITFPNGEGNMGMSTRR